MNRLARFNGYGEDQDSAPSEPGSVTLPGGDVAVERMDAEELREPIIEALRSTERVVGNRVIQRALERIGQHIAEGQNVSVAFAASNLFPPLVTRMLRVGENTGALDTALANLRYFYDRDVQESTERLQAVVEPLLTLVLGAVLLWIMMSVLGPIYDIISRLPV